MNVDYPAPMEEHKMPKHGFSISQEKDYGSDDITNLPEE